MFCLRTQRECTGQGSNSRPSGPKSDALTTEAPIGGDIKQPHTHKALVLSPSPLHALSEGDIKEPHTLFVYSGQYLSYHVLVDFTHHGNMAELIVVDCGACPI